MLPLLLDITMHKNCFLFNLNILFVCRTCRLYTFFKCIKNISLKSTPVYYENELFLASFLTTVVNLNNVITYFFPAHAKKK